MAAIETGPANTPPHVESLTDQLHASKSITALELEVFNRWKGRVCKISLVSNSNDGGTGILIASGVILTCKHVLPRRDFAKKYHICFEGIEKVCRFAPNVLASSLSSGVNNPKKDYLDYIIVAIDTKDLPLEILEIGYMAESNFNEGVVSSATPKLSNVSLVHYPSQEAMQKQLILGTGSVTEKTVYTIAHDIATEKGSSGGPLLDASGHLIGMHRVQRSAVSIEQILASLGPDAKEAIEKVSNDFLERILTERLSETVSSHYQKTHANSSIYKVKDRNGAWEMSLPIEGVYTSLAMIAEEERKEKSEKEETFEDRRIQTYESLVKIKKPIKPEELFEQEKLKNKLEKKVVIFGVAGVGKTTFAQMAALKGKEWWPQFKVIFLVKLRNLNGEKDPYIALSEECGFNLREYQTFLENFSKEEMLLILDGYDELPLSGEGTYKNLREAFPHILVTSRPTRVDLEYQTELEIMGFDEDSISSYIDKFYHLLAADKSNIMCEDEALRKIEDLKKIIKARPILRSLVQIPINLTLACTLFKEDEKIFTDPDRGFTVTTFYIEAVNWFYKRYLMRDGISTQNSGKIRDLIHPRNQVLSLAKKMEKLAWDAMEKSTLYFDQGAVEDLFGDSTTGFDALKEIGLMSFENGKGQFIHLTFQEYLAAIYLGEQIIESPEEGRARLRSVKFDPRFSLTLRMTAGYLSHKEDQAPLHNFFQELFDQPRDLGQSYELRLFAQCFEECKKPEEVKPQYDEFIFQLLGCIEKTKHPLMIHPIFSSNYKLIHNPQVIDQLSEGLNESSGHEFFEQLVKLVNEGIFLPDKLMGKLVEFLVKNDKMWWVLGTMASKGQPFSQEILLTLFNYIEQSIKGSAIRDVLAAVALTGHPFSEDLVGKMINRLTNSNKNRSLQILAGIVRGGGKLPGGASVAIATYINDPQLSSEHPLIETEELVSIAQRDIHFTLDAQMLLAQAMLDHKKWGGAQSRIQRALEVLSKRGVLDDKVVEFLSEKAKASTLLMESRSFAISFFVSITEKDTDLATQIVLHNLKSSNLSEVKEACKGLFSKAKSGKAFPESILQALINLTKTADLYDDSIDRIPAEILMVCANNQVFSEAVLLELVEIFTEKTYDMFTRNYAKKALIDQVKKKEFPDAIRARIGQIFVDFSVDDQARTSAFLILNQSSKKESAILNTGIEKFVDTIGDNKEEDRNRIIASKSLVSAIRLGGSLHEGAINALKEMGGSLNRNVFNTALETLTTLAILSSQEIKDEILRILLGTLKQDNFLDDDILPIASSFQQISPNEELPEELTRQLVKFVNSSICEGRNCGKIISHLEKLVEEGVVFPDEIFDLLAVKIEGPKAEIKGRLVAMQLFTALLSSNNPLHIAAISCLNKIIHENNNSQNKNIEGVVIIDEDESHSIEIGRISYKSLDEAKALLGAAAARCLGELAKICNTIPDESIKALIEMGEVYYPPISEDQFIFRKKAAQGRRESGRLLLGGGIQSKSSEYAENASLEDRDFERYLKPAVMALYAIADTEKQLPVRSLLLFGKVALDSDITHEGWGKSEIRERAIAILLREAQSKRTDLPERILTTLILIMEDETLSAHDGQTSHVILEVAKTLGGLPDACIKILVDMLYQDIIVDSIRTGNNITKINMANFNAQFILPSLAMIMRNDFPQVELNRLKARLECPIRTDDDLCIAVMVIEVIFQKNQRLGLQELEILVQIIEEATSSFSRDLGFREQLEVREPIRFRLPKSWESAIAILEVFKLEDFSEIIKESKNLDLIRTICYLTYRSLSLEGSEIIIGDGRTIARFLRPPGLSTIDIPPIIADIQPLGTLLPGDQVVNRSTSSEKEISDEEESTNNPKDSNKECCNSCNLL